MFFARASPRFALSVVMFIGWHASQMFAWETESGNVKIDLGITLPEIDRCKNKFAEMMGWSVERLKVIAQQVTERRTDG